MEEGEISTHMVQWVESIPTESIVLVKGYLHIQKYPSHAAPSTT